MFADNPSLKVDLELIYAHMIFLERYREDFPVIEKYFAGSSEFVNIQYFVIQSPQKNKVQVKA